MTGAPTSEISFLVPVRNDAARLARCLDSIVSASAGIPHEIIVMDHMSGDDSAAVARARGARVLSLQAPNVAALRNAGAAEAGAPLLAFVDADHELARGWTAAACRTLADGAVAAAGALYHAPRDGTWVQRTYDLLRRHALRVEPAEWFGAGNLVIRRAVFAELGGFDTTLESCEDVELCFRLQASGALMLAVPALYSTHHGDPTTLGRLFVAELWRGRDNLRVSLRGPRSFSNFASATLPLGMLGAAGVALVGALTLTPPGLLLALVAVAGIVGIILLRTAAMVRRLDRVSVVAVVQAVVVAAVYEAARAAAIVLRASHHRRHDRVPVGA